MADRHPTIHKARSLWVRGTLLRLATISLVLIPIMLLGSEASANYESDTAVARWPKIPCGFATEPLGAEVGRVTISDPNFVEGQRVRVTVTVGAFPPKHTQRYDKPQDPAGFDFYTSGIWQIQAGWSRQEILDFGGAADRMTVDGTSVRFFPPGNYGTNSQNGENFIGNMAFEPGSVLWIDYRAPDPDTRPQFPGALFFAAHWPDGTFASRVDATTNTCPEDLVSPEPNPPLVNSTGDAPAVDAAMGGCDTGAMIGGEPECTLRAAIQTANATDERNIRFDIDGTEIPVIAPATQLPALGVSAVVDGTTQTAGAVRIDGTGLVKVGLELTAGTSSVSGLELDGFDIPVSLTGGAAHEISNNRIGVAGAEPAIAVEVDGVAGAVIKENVMRCQLCIVLTQSPDALVENNLLGVDNDGSLLGTGLIGVLVSDGKATVRLNIVNTKLIGVLVRGAAAGGTTVDQNRIGVGADGLSLGAEGEGIRVDASPTVSVINNRIATSGTSRAGGIFVSGSAQTFFDQVEGEDGVEIVVLPPSDASGDSVTGGFVTIKNNTIGLLGDGTTPVESLQEFGIAVWGGASNVMVVSNTVAKAQTGLTVIGGSDLTVTGNLIGIGERSGGAVGTFGISVTDTSTATIGTVGDPNRVVAISSGVGLADTSGITVQGNVVDALNGINAIGSQNELMIADNLVTGDGDTAVGVGAGATSASVINNIVLGHATGILSRGSGTLIAGNSVGAGTGVVDGNGTGIHSVGAAKIERNTVVASETFGVRVGAGVNTLTGNEIRGTTGQPIATASGPTAPVLTAAIDVSAGAQDRTMLVVTGLPKAGGGTIEIFANDSCTDPEAQHVLNVTIKKTDGRAYVIVPLVGHAARDSFTATFTTVAAGTSELSNCEARTTYPDRDGDGSPDPLDDIAGTGDDDNTALLVTDQGELIIVNTSNGSLGETAIIEDPAPTAHPGEFTLPYGVIDFQVTGLEDGAATTVTIRSFDNTSTIAGTSYWKHGPNPRTAGSSWFEFGLDAETNTGATQQVDADGRFWELSLVDGLRGDNDQRTNGTIADPGGPAIGGQANGATTAPSGTPVCIETTRVQTDVAAAKLGVDDTFRGTDDGLLYQISSGAPTCTFNCLDGFDINCDGVLGDTCPIELNLNQVRDAGTCLELLAANASPQTEASVSAVDPEVAAPVASVPPATAAGSGPPLAVTGAHTDLLLLVGLGLVSAGATVVGLRRRHDQRC